MEYKKRKFLSIELFFLVLLAIYPLRHIHMGVDLWDAGYNYANFRYNGLEHMDSMWYFATWLANGIGSLFTCLPFGDTCLGMNIYTSLVVSLMAATAFLFCVRKLKMPAWLVFLAEMLAISLCWLPTAVLYTYLTYAFLLAALILLYQGVLKEQNGYLIGAGIVLGLNVAVRFSNLAQMALILIVWSYGIIAKKKFSRVLQETGCCVLGYVGALAAFLGVMAARYGLNHYIEGVWRLFGMTEHAEDYAPGYMVLSMLKTYYKNTYFLKRYAVVYAVALAACVLLPKKWSAVKKIISILASFFLMVWLVRIHFFVRDFAMYDAIFYPCVTVLTITLCLSVYQLVDKNVSKEDKLLGIILILVILLTCLGSNNAIHANINNMFLVLPGFFGQVWRFCREKTHIYFYPVKCALLLSGLILVVQGVQFGVGFVYEEARGGRDFSAVIEEVPILEGMRTNPEKAKAIEGLYQYLQENRLGDRECILYGEIPAVAYFAELAPALNIWSDLPSYDYEVMVQELQKVEGRPIIILSAECGQYVIDRDASGLFREETAHQKMELLCSYIEEEGYQTTFSNTEFVLYE